MNGMRVLTILGSICLCSSLAAADKSDRAKTVLVHYMPWFASKPVSGHWGWHWTMDRFRPDRTGPDGRLELASHYRPLIGAYDSSDPDALECQVLLMKFAGISGVIIDWYGTERFRDYATIHRNSVLLISHLKRAGLKFAICYEDQTISHMIAGGRLRPGEEVAHGVKEFKWLEKNLFADQSHVRLRDKPILLIFGPQHFKKEQWGRITGSLSSKPRLFTLPHLTSKTKSAGAFGWPPVSGGRKVTSAGWQKYLEELYSREEGGESIIAPVFPGFHDIYQQAGVHESYGYLDDEGGRTFDRTLSLAWKSSCELIQIVTWNDYGEGTAIEPTEEFGYRYLETLQRRIAVGVKFAYSAQDLRLPVLLYKLRKQHSGKGETAPLFAQASRLLFASRTEEARAVLMQLRKQKQ